MIVTKKMRNYINYKLQITKYKTLVLTNVLCKVGEK